ncbi:MAG: extracellular solute-binding protein [Variovorax sp.]
MLKFAKTIVAAGLTAAVALHLPAASAADVDFMNWSSTEEVNKAPIKAMEDSFTKATGLTVNSIGYAWGEMVKNAFLRGRTNTLPDVMQVQARLLPTVAGIDGIVDMNQVYGKQKLEAMFPPNMLAFGNVDGKQVALPWIGGTIGMVANKAVMSKAGIDAPPATVADFRNALIKIRDKIPNSVPYGMATKNNNSIVLDYMIWVWTFGGDVVANGKPMVDSKEATAALKFMADLVKDRLAAPEIDRPDARRLFGQEASGFYFDPPIARTFAVDFSGKGPSYAANVIPMSTPTLAAGGTPASIQWGHVLSIFGAKNAKADSPAAKFVMHLLNDDTLVDFASFSGVLPSTTTGVAKPKIADDPYLANWAKHAGTPRRNTLASLSNGAAVANVIGEEVQAAVLGQKTAEVAAHDMQARLVKTLAN